ncbi:hypothetical protein HK102_003102 [Quaeritorhiza haematococci]|nr:hypothetical protein HK102_003102 [Quaeritorhiza haematococci]
MAAPYSTTIWIVRHGERVDHVDPRWAATTKTPWDPSLTSVGVQQAAATGTFIASQAATSRQTASGPQPQLPIKYIFSSPFLRCVETAVQIQKALPPAPATSPSASQESLGKEGYEDKTERLVSRHSVTNISPTSSTEISALSPLMKKSSSFVSMAGAVADAVLQRARSSSQHSLSMISPTPSSPSLSLSLSINKEPQLLSVPSPLTNPSSPTALTVPLNLETGLCEWLTPAYFPSAPPKISVAGRKAEFPTLNETYKSPSPFMWPRYPESSAAMRCRYIQTLFSLIDKYGRDSAIVIVTHGDAVQAMVEAFAPGTTVDWAPYCSVTKLVKNKGDRGRGWKVEYLCDSSHLSASSSDSATSDL